MVGSSDSPAPPEVVVTSRRRCARHDHSYLIDLEGCQVSSPQTHIFSNKDLGKTRGYFYWFFFSNPAENLLVDTRGLISKVVQRRTLLFHDSTLWCVLTRELPGNRSYSAQKQDTLHTYHSPAISLVGRLSVHPPRPRRKKQDASKGHAWNCWLQAPPPWARETRSPLPLASWLSTQLVSFLSCGGAAEHRPLGKRPCRSPAAGP